MPRKNTRQVGTNVSAAEYAALTQLAQDDGGIAPYLRKLIAENAAQRGIDWPNETKGQGQPMNKAQIVALWIYTGNSPNGRDHARKGDFALARAAYNYWQTHGDDEYVQRVPPSQARCKAEKSAFGRTYAFRVVNPAKVLQWDGANVG